MTQDKDAPSRQLYQSRVEPLLRSRLEAGEVMLESCFAQLTAPGMLLLTDRRLMFAGQGVVLRRRPSIVLVPRSMIKAVTLQQSRFDAELHVATDHGTFKFFSVDVEAARRLIAAHETHKVSISRTPVFIHAPRPRARFAPLLLVIAGAVLAFRWPIVGLTVVGVGVLYKLVRLVRERRVPRIGG
jgi:hypothetical protein